jgi:hypothetical protein
VRTVVHMIQSKARQLAVVERGNSHSLVGLLTMGDIVSVQARATLAVGKPDKAMVPELSSLEDPNGWYF